MNKILTHPFKPIFDVNSRILILGTFPSVKSRENNFYYGHPQNRFWKVISALTQTQLPVDVFEKIELLVKNKIAVWDVLRSCQIKGSSDITIKNEIPNDLNSILKYSKIGAIFANGNTAYKLFLKHNKNKYNPSIICLPSTSPANARFRLDALINSWSALLVYLR